MKTILKIIGYCLLSVVGLVSVAAGYVAISGQFILRPIELQTLSFGEGGYLVYEDFEEVISFTPENATKKEVNLTVVRGANAVKVPSKVIAGQPFKIELLKDEFGNNIGGEVEIKASNNVATTTENLKFWIDVAIPYNGLKVISDVPSGKLTSGGSAIKVYVYTDPKLALYPDNRTTSNFLDEAYKNIKITSSNPNALRVLNNGVGIQTKGYYNPNYESNKLLPFSPTPTTYHTQLMRYVEFSVQPLLSGTTINLEFEALRTYAMQEEFVNINDAKFGGNYVVAYQEFSNYIEKFKDYIKSDMRSFTQGVVTYENGEDFIEKVTRSVNGVMKVDISPNSETEYNAAMFYLYVKQSQQFNIYDVEISELTTTNNIEIKLFERLDLDVMGLISKFGLNLKPKNSSFDESTLRAKIANVKIEAFKGIDEDNDGELDKGFDTNGDGEISEDELDDLVLVPASEEFLIENPNLLVNPTNPRWIIQSLNPQMSVTDGLRFKFSITETGGEEPKIFYDFVEVTVRETIISDNSFKLAEIPNMTINAQLKEGYNEVKIFNLTDNIYEFTTSTGQMPSYNKVKFFITKDSALTTEGYNVVRFSADYSAKLLTMPHLRTAGVTEAYEIVYSNGINRVLEAINVSNAGPVQIFAAIVKTDYLGEEIVDANGNYTIVEMSNIRSFNITAYLEKINFYTKNPETGIYTKRSLTEDGDNRVINLLSNNSYTIYATNLELTPSGEFDAEKYTNNDKINHQVNLNHALRSVAYGSSTNPVNYIKFESKLFSDVGDEYSLQIDLGEQVTYTYDPATNLISIGLSVTSRRDAILRQNHNTMPEFVFNFYADYEGMPAPVDLRANSTIGINIVFASLTDDLKIINTSGQTSGQITVKATPTQGPIQWLHEGPGEDKIFDISDVEYDYDILVKDLIGNYISPKIDISYNTPTFVEGYFKEVDNGLGNYKYVADVFVQVGPGNGDYLLIENEYVYAGPGLGEFNLIPGYYDFVGANNGNYIFVPGYLQKLRDLTKVTWSSSHPEYVQLTNRTDEGFTNLPNFKILKGTPEGVLVTLKAIVEIYPDINGNYLQYKEKTIQLLVKQENPQEFLYTERENANLVEPGNPTGKHLVRNTSDRAFLINGGEGVNLLATYTTPLKVYNYDNDSTASLADYTGVQNNTLIDVKFMPSNGSIIGALEFEIVPQAQTTPSIFFRDPETNAKIYKTSAIRVNDGGSYYYELMLYSESITSPKNEVINIITPFGNTYPYNVKVLTNIEITVPVGQNIRTNDTEEIDLLNSIYGKQQVKVVNSGVEDLVEIDLPITFELTGTPSTNYSELNIQQNTNAFGVGINTLNGVTKSSKPYVLNQNENESFAKTVAVNTILTPYLVSEAKNLGIRMYYFVPSLDNEGHLIYVAPDSEDSSIAHKLYYNDGKYYLDEEFTTEYTDVKYFLFEKREYEGQLGSVILNPTVLVQKGELLQEPIEIQSGSNNVNLYNVEADSNNTASITTTNFVDIVQNNANRIIVLPNGLPQTLTDGMFNYASEYTKYFKAAFTKSNLNEAQQALFDQLQPNISSSGVVTSNSINSDLLVNLEITRKEGFNGTRDGVKFVIQVLFTNSVHFDINNIEIDDLPYIDGTDTQTGQEMGHIYKGINEISGNAILMNTKSQVLYSASNDVNENIVNILGGQNEDLLKDNLTTANIYYFNGITYVLYNPTVKAVDVVVNRVGGAVSNITLNITRSLNETTKFKVEFVSNNFELIGNYYFTVTSGIRMIGNYPVFNEYVENLDGTYSNSGHEVVISGSQINLHSNYINVLPRTQIQRVTYELVGMNETGDYEQIVISGVNTGLFRKVDTGTGTHKQVVTTYNIKTISEIVYLVPTIDTVEDENQKVAVIGIDGETSYGVQKYTYTLLNVQKQVVSSLPQVTSINASTGVITFNNSISTADLYVRVTTFNGTYVDYKFRAQQNQVREEIDLRRGQAGTLITEQNPLEVYANTDINLYDYIFINYGSKNQLLVKYNDLENVFGFINHANVGQEPELERINMYTYVQNGQRIRLNNVATPQIVSFDVYGYNFINGDAPKKLWIRVVPNITITTVANEVYAGNPIPVVQSEQGQLALFALGLDYEDAEISISKINGSAYSSNNPYGAKIETDGIFLIRNISSAVDIEFTITKEYSCLIYQNGGIIYTTTRTITFKPNAIFTPTYNNNAQQYEQVTAPAADKEIEFNTSSKVQIKNSQGQDIVTFGENITVEYVLLVNGVEVSPSTSVLGVKDGSLDTETGEFSIIPVNEDTWIYVKVKVIWHELVGNDNAYDVEYSYTYRIKVVPNVMPTTITYPANGTKLSVYAGSTIELDFVNPQNAFAEQNLQVIKIDAMQTDTDSNPRVNIVLIEANTSEYQIYKTSNKHYITFKHVGSANVEVTIPVYLDLTGNVIGVTNASQNNFYNPNKLIRFEIKPSIENIELKSTYTIHQNPSTPLSINYFDPIYVPNEDGEGNFTFNDGYYYVGENEGSYVYDEDDEIYIFVGVGEGDYEFNPSLVGYEFTQGEGDHDLTFTSSSLRYVYVGEIRGVKQGHYNLIGNEFVFSENDGLYNLLSPNQYDLFEFFNITLLNGLTYSQESMSGLYIERAQLRNALIVNVTQNPYLVRVENGVITFLPTDITRTVTIQVELDKSGSTPITLHFSVGAGGRLFVNSMQDGEINSNNNPIVVDLSVKNTYNLYELVTYGYVLNSYVDEAQNESENSEISLSNNIVVINRLGVGENSNQQTIYTLIKLQSQMLSYTISAGSNFATISNGVITFTNNTSNNGTVIVHVFNDNLQALIYFNVEPIE